MPLARHPVFLARPGALQLNATVAAVMLGGGSAHVSAEQVRRLQVAQREQHQSAAALQERIRAFEATIEHKHEFAHQPAALVNATAHFPGWTVQAEPLPHLPAAAAAATASSSADGELDSGAPEHERVLQTWLRSLLAEHAAARAPLLAEVVVDAASGARALEVNSATLAAIELSLAHKVAQRTDEYARATQAAYQRRVREVSGEAATAIRAATARAAHRVRHVTCSIHTDPHTLSEIHTRS